MSDSFDFGTVAIYTCNTGFGLSGGDVQTTCSGDSSSVMGSWTGTVPSCERESNSVIWNASYLWKRDTHNPNITKMMQLCM